MNSFKKQIEHLLANTKSQVSLLIKELETDTILYELDSHRQLVSASTIKVPIMFCAFNEVILGNLSLNQQINVVQSDILSDSEVFEHGETTMSLIDLVSWMIISSDNTATNVLIRTLGMEHINQYIKEILKLEYTKLERIMLDYDAIKQGKNNYTSQIEQCMMYEKLFHHEILTPALCETAIEILNNQRCQNQLMRYLPQNISFAHKTGELDYLIHDCGVLCTHHHKIYIGVSLYECEKQEGDFPLMGQLGKIIISALTQENTI